MGRHDAPEDNRPGRLRTIIVYCQPFYKRYRKGIVAVLSAVFITGQAVVTNGITPDEWAMIITAALGAAGVIQVPNATNKKVVKDANVQ